MPEFDPPRRLRLHLLQALSIFLIFPAQAVGDQGEFGKVIRVKPDAFLPEAGRIGFDEFRVRTINPVYEPAEYGAGPAGVTVVFNGFFAGQRLGDRSQCPVGANRHGCVVGAPTDPLTLARSAPRTFTDDDGANPRSPSLSGSPRFNGPISMVFSKDVAGVGLMGGYFDLPRSTAIRAFDRRGNMIGGVRNIGTGMEYLALVTEDGRERIAGLQFSLVGPEPAGYGIDDLSFAFSTQLDANQIPALAEILGGADAVDPGEDGPKSPGRDEGSLSDLIGSTETGRRDGSVPRRPEKSISDLLD